MGWQGATEPFLRAGPIGTVRPEGDVVKKAEIEEGCRACTMLSLPDSTHCKLERSAQQRGKVAHTARPGNPESKERKGEDEQVSAGEGSAVRAPGHPRTLSKHSQDYGKRFSHHERLIS